jgi:hypothetical protein
MIHGENISWFFLQHLIHLRILIKEVTWSTQFRVLYVVLLAKIDHSPNFKQWKVAKQSSFLVIMKSWIIAATQGRNEVIWRPRHLLIWHHFVSSHQGTLSKEMNVGQNCPEKAVSWGWYFYEFRGKAIFLSKKSSRYEIILWLTEWVPGIHLVTRD